MRSYTVTVADNRPGASALASVVVGHVEYPAPPQGFDLGQHGRLDWLAPPKDILDRLPGGGAALTGGCVKVVRIDPSTEIKVVEFDQRVQGKKLMVRVETRPQLKAAVDWWYGRAAAVAAAQSAHWNAERDTAKGVAKQAVPFGNVLLRRIGSEADGWVSIWSMEDGSEIRNVEVTPCDPAGGEWCHATPKAIEQARTWMAQEEEAKAARLAATAMAHAASKASEMAVAVPDWALAAFRRYGGSFDRAWEREDEGAAMAIQNFGRAIEAQGLDVAQAGKLPPREDLATSES